MTEFIMICAAIGILTIYLLCTLAPGFLVYHFIKDTTIDKPWDFRAIAKSITVPYCIGLVAFMWVVIYFLFVRG